MISTTAGGRIAAMALISAAEAAKRSGLTDARIRQLAAAGLVRAQKFGSSWAIDERSLDSYLKKERKPGPKPLDKRLRKRK